MGGIYRLNFIALALAVVVTGLAMVPSTALFSSGQKPLSEAQLERFQYCGADEDCMVVTNGCCDCANGGRDSAIARSAARDFQALFNCQRTACTERAANPPVRFRRCLLRAASLPLLQCPRV